MIDFSKVRSREATIAELVEGLTVADMRDLTDEMIDRQLELIAGCADSDVVFTPEDPIAKDLYAASEAEANLPWTLGHVVVHATASSEESAFLAAEMARGVAREGRSRYETPWATVTTVAQCRARLEESRRMRLATLDVWPAEPHFEITVDSKYHRVPIHAKARFVLGLLHDQNHLGQMEEIVRQARATRQPV